MSTTSEPIGDDDETYCRLCAEPTPLAHLIAHDTKEAIGIDVAGKCAEINIDFSENNHLPKTICYSCFDMLRKSFIFIHSAKKAQQKLLSMFPNAVTEQPKPNLLDEIKEQKDEKDIKVEVVIDPSEVTEGLVLKKEPYSDSEEVGFSMCDAGGSDSDAPLLLLERKRKTKKKKKKRDSLTDVVKEEIEFPEELMSLEADALPLDVAQYNMTWLDYEWRCAKCEALCKDIASLRLHSLELHACCVVFKCTQCGKKLTQHKGLVRHARLHYRSLRHYCEHCNERFKSTRQLSRHLLEHAGAHSCPTCGMGFDTEQSMTEHVLKYSRLKKRRRRSVTTEENLTCDHCNKKFKSRSNLLAHRTVHAERTRNFSCHVCGKMFYTNGTLMTHMATHEETKPFKCDYCPMAFRARGNLLSHASLHSGVKPFVCEQCGKSFRVKRHLKSHLIVHTDLMPFRCEFCGKPFRFKTRLNLHLRQHTGAKPYKCVHCQRDFTNGSNYKKHMKRRHNIDTGKKSEQVLVAFPLPQVEKFEEN